jgi:hypothetical protein
MFTIPVEDLFVSYFLTADLLSRELRYLMVTKKIMMEKRTHPIAV